MRELVTIRKISEINPIPNADAIEVATVDGWQVVTKKNEFNLGDNCVYFEIDSFLPESDERFSFLMKNGVRTQDGISGHVLRTVELRGQISQGLVLPLGTPENTIFPEIWEYLFVHNMDDTSPYLADFSQLLGVVKWDPPIPAELAGHVEGPFPGFIPVTDQIRIQNVPKFLEDKDDFYEVTMKLDGSSMTAFVKDGKLGVCSRNWQLKISEENAGNTFVRYLKESGLGEAMLKFGDNFAVQGELMGPGIQKNRENFRMHQFFIYDIFDIDTQQFLPSVIRRQLAGILMKATGNVVNHVPIIEQSIRLGDIGSLPNMLKYAEGPSMNHKIREGLVFKREDGKRSFKVISNKYLLGEK